MIINPPSRLLLWRCYIKVGEVNFFMAAIMTQTFIAFLSTAMFCRFVDYCESVDVTCMNGGPRTETLVISLASCA